MVLGRETLARCEFRCPNADASAASAKGCIPEVEVKRDHYEVVCEAILHHVRVISIREPRRLSTHVAMSTTIQVGGHLGNHVLVGEEPYP